jgi:hypothetical protein
MNESAIKILPWCDGARTSAEIAKEVGLSPRYVRRLMERHDMPRLNEGARVGADNNMFVCGRRIDNHGYAMVTAPKDHPFARKRSQRDTKLLAEHRLVLEEKLGRYLLPKEVVDHIDGLTLHNAPKNLRVFASNAEHLRETLAGKRPAWTTQGYQNMQLRFSLHPVHQRVDTYRQRSKLGEIRLQQILLAALSLGIDSPYLSGTHFHTKKAGIDMSSRSTIERALADLYARWEASRAQYE